MVIAGEVFAIFGESSNTYEDLKPCQSRHIFLYRHEARFFRGVHTWRQIFSRCCLETSH